MSDQDAIKQIKGNKLCSECGAEISSKAEICPRCGVRMRSLGINKVAAELKKMMNFFVPDNLGKFYLDCNKIGVIYGELVLGVIGGILGILAGFPVMFMGGLGSAFGLSGSNTLTSPGSAGILLGTLGIVGGSIVGMKEQFVSIHMDFMIFLMKNISLLSQMPVVVFLHLI